MTVYRESDAGQLTKADFVAGLDPQPPADPTYVTTERYTTDRALPGDPHYNAGRALALPEGAQVNTAILARLFPVPTIASITPPSGPAAGGPIVIKGTGFTPGMDLTFDGTPATGLTDVSEIEAHATAPAHAAGAVDVEITTDEGTTVTETAGYLYT